MLLFALACSDPEPPPAPPPAPIEVTLGLAAKSPLHGLAWVAHDQGIFEAHALQVEVVPLEGSRAVARALEHDEISWGLCDGATIFRWDFEQGGDLVLVAGLVDRSFRRIVARPPLNEVEDLRGKRIGVGRELEAEHLATMIALDAAGLGPGEVEYVFGQQRSLAPVRSREVDAQVTLRAVEDLQVILDFDDTGASFTTLQLVTRDPRARTEEAERMVAALQEAEEAMRADPSAAVALLAPHLELTAEELAPRLDRQLPALDVRTDHTDGLQAIIDLLAREDVLYRGHSAEALLP